MCEDLVGKRVLIVEDSPILAFEMVDLLTDAGGQPVGPAHNLSAAQRFARMDALDAALLDIDLNGETVWPLANELADQAVPIVFVSSECTGRKFPEQFRGCCCIEKPAVGSDILDGLVMAMMRLSAPQAASFSSMSTDER